MEDCTVLCSFNSLVRPTGALLLHVLEMTEVRLREPHTDLLEGQDSSQRVLTFHLCAQPLDTSLPWKASLLGDLKGRDFIKNNGLGIFVYFEADGVQNIFPDAIRLCFN